MEHKLFSLEAAEFKFSTEKPGFFTGYASKFNGVDAYGDTILPGAYAKTLEGRTRPVQMRWNHRGPVIGKFTTIKEDAVGLYVEGELTPGHSVAEDARASMKHGAVTGLSIGYRIPDGGSEKSEHGGRLLKQIDLVEISVVESPADVHAQISSVKSAIDEAESLKEIETLLRDAGGFSRADACALVARIKSMQQRESVAEEDQFCAAVALTFAKFTS